MKTRQFIKRLEAAVSEEEVKAIYVRWLDLDFEIRNRVDCVSKNVFWEFKHDVSMSKPETRAKLVAQVLYYVKKESETPSPRALPTAVACADKNGAFVVELNVLHNVIAAPDINWARQPSSPDPALVQRLLPIVSGIPVYQMALEEEADLFYAEIHRIQRDEENAIIRKQITGENFIDVFNIWQREIGACFDGYESILHGIFAKDLSGDPAQVYFNPDTGDIQVVFENAKPIKSKVPVFAYKRFWSIWQRPPTQKEYDRILRAFDCIKDSQFRRITGSFFTPLSVVRLQMYYMRKMLGEDFEDKYYVWDPACGTANLVYEFSTYENVFLSTSDDGEIDVIKRYALAPGAEIFKYDFLNDDIDLLEHRVPYTDSRWEKLPARLRHALQHEPHRLIILMNPPFGQNTALTEFSAGRNVQIQHSATKLYGLLKKQKRREAGDLGTQFIARALMHAPSVFSYGRTSFLFGRKSLDPAMCEIVGLFIVPGKLFSGISKIMPIIFAKMNRNHTNGASDGSSHFRRL